MAIYESNQCVFCGEDTHRGADALFCSGCESQQGPSRAVILGSAVRPDALDPSIVSLRDRVLTDPVPEIEVRPKYLTGSRRTGQSEKQ